MEKKKTRYNFSWQDYVLIAAVIFFLLSQWYITHDLQQLPSPLYGGDYYYQMGCINSIREGGGMLSGCSILGSEPGYLPLYGNLVALFANIFNLETLDAMIYFSFLLILITLPVFYFILLYIFENKNIALLGLLVLLTFNEFPVFKYTSFTKILLIPLIFFCLYYFLKKPSIKAAIFFGIVYGLAAISHSVAFIAVNLLLFVVFLYCIFSGALNIAKFNFSKQVFIKNFKKYFLFFLIIFLIGFAIAQLYWFKPIFVYHGQAQLESQKWSISDFTDFSVQIDFLFDTIKNIFFNISSLQGIILSILALAGIFFLIKNWKEKQKHTLLYYFIILTLIVGILAALHYFFTENLFETNFAPGHLRSFLLDFPVVFIMLYGIKCVFHKWKKYTKQVFAVLFIILIMFQVQAHIDKNNEDYFQHAKNPLDEQFLEMQEFIQENTQINDVFLSTNSLSFMLNGLTGRKLVVTRRAQNSPFLDFDQREADAAVILYGKDDAKRKELLEKYGVNYVYWDYRWIETEYYFDKETFKIESANDPLTVFDKPGWREYFDLYGVPYKAVNDHLDPAANDDYEELDILRILPEYSNMIQPWHSGLNNYLEEVWRYEEEGLTLANIYKVNI